MRNERRRGELRTHLTGGVDDITLILVSFMINSLGEVALDSGVI